MLERNDRESEGVEVRPEEKASETGVGEVATGPRLFSELGTGITTREVVIPTGSPTDGEADEGALETEDAPVPSPPILTGRRKGGPYRRVVEAEPRPGEAGVALSGEQRLLILDAWSRSELTAGEFGKIAGVSPHTLYAWRRRVEELGPAGLDAQRRGGRGASPVGGATEGAV